MREEVQSVKVEAPAGKTSIDVSLDQRKLLGFEHLAAFDVDLTELRQAVDATLNKIGNGEVQTQLIPHGS